MTRAFQKKVEDFKCENCGHFVKGSGYTNHCPKCLYSLHVDVNPGDRSESCHGKMEPIEVVGAGEDISIIHKCLSCGVEKKNKISAKDDYNIVVEIAKKNGSN